MEDEHVAIEILDEAHVAHTAVLDADHFATRRAELLDRGVDVFDPQLSGRPSTSR